MTTSGMVLIYPSLTNQIVLKVFELLVEFELKKKRKGAFEFQYGHQEGVIRTISLLFGGSNDFPPQHWSLLTEKLVNEELKDWASTIENQTDFEDIDELELKSDIKKAVESFAIKNPTQLVDALKNL